VILVVRVGHDFFACERARLERMTEFGAGFFVSDLR